MNMIGLMVSQEVIMDYSDVVSNSDVAMEVMSRLRNTGSVILSTIYESIGTTAIRRASLLFIAIRYIKFHKHK